MRVLLFAYYFPPLGGIGSLRALGLARHLPGEVTVIAPRTGTFGRDPSLREPEGARVVRTGTLEPSVLLGRADRVPGPAAGGAAPARRGRLGGVIRRLLQVPDANVGWVPAAVRAGLREARARRPDAILSSSPPLSAHLAAASVARRLRIPFVPDFRDFFATQRLFRGVRERLDERLERGVLLRASGFVAATRGVLADVAARTDLPGHVMENGFDEEDFAGPAPAVAGGPPFDLVHVGTTMADRRDPSAFLGAVSDLREGGTAVRLRFRGAPDPALAAAAERAGVRDGCEFGGFLTHAEAVAEMRAAPALLLFVWGREGRIDRGILAGKTMEYLASGRPVLVVGPGDGETARTVRQVGGGLFAEIDDRAGLRDAIARLAAGERPAPADPAALRARTRKAGAERLARWLADLVGSGR